MPYITHKVTSLVQGRCGFWIQLHLSAKPTPMSLSCALIPGWWEWQLPAFTTVSPNGHSWQKWEVPLSLSPSHRWEELDLNVLYDSRAPILTPLPPCLSAKKRGTQEIEQTSMMKPKASFWGGNSKFQTTSPVPPISGAAIEKSPCRRRHKQ